MLNLRGFVTFESLENTTPGVTSKLGQLSTLSLTFSDHKINHLNIDYPGLILVGFDCFDTVTNEKKIIDPVLGNMCLAIASACQDYFYQNTSSNFVKSNFIQWINTQFVNQISNFACGNFVVAANGMTMVEWFSFQLASGTQSTARIWLCDGSFQSEYDLYSIIIVPPIDSIDDFFKSPTTIKTQLDAITPASFITRAGTYITTPETKLVANSYGFISPFGSQNNTMVSWGAIVYGSQGAITGNIKDAMRQYIAAHSTHTTAEWEEIFPEIYQTNEFVIIPRWDLYSIPSTTTIPGIYRSILKVQDSINFVSNYATFLDPDFVAANIFIMPYSYKHISLLAVPGINNGSINQNLANLYNDYIPETSLGLDYNRMSAKTQRWIETLDQLIQLAEITKRGDSLPTGFYNIYRDNKFYISALYEGIEYIVAAKTDYS